MKTLQTFLLFVLLQLPLLAQSLEPRLYSNVPKDLNFLIVGYTKSLGGLELNTQLDLQDANMDVDVALLAYARGFDLFGKSAKIDIAIPYMHLHGNAIYNGDRVERSIDGVGDIKSRIAFNFYGAPALALKNFAAYKQELILGGSFQLTMPTGKYDATKLVNIGRNVWAAKLGMGASKRLNRLIVELAADAEFYSKNSNYYNGNSYEQRPVYSAQTHLIYTFDKGIWIGADANYFLGGETKFNDVLQGNALANSRYGGVIAFPLSRYDSIKVNFSSGINTRVGTDFTTAGLVYQYRWGGGL
ncbi:MAG: hypothetical protein JXQ67_00625 [Campylobacterales bacterium]|nr:hypothetical protein [Campylobacterales bacterium]